MKSFDSNRKVQLTYVSFEILNGSRSGDFGGGGGVSSASTFITPALPSRIFDFFTCGCGILIFGGGRVFFTNFDGSMSSGMPRIMFSSFGSNESIFGFGTFGIDSGSQITSSSPSAVNELFIFHGEDTVPRIIGFFKFL